MATTTVADQDEVESDVREIYSSWLLHGSDSFNKDRSVPIFLAVSLDFLLFHDGFSRFLSLLCIASFHAVVVVAVEDCSFFEIVTRTSSLLALSIYPADMAALMRGTA